MEATTTICKDTSYIDSFSKKTPCMKLCSYMLKTLNRIDHKFNSNCKSSCKQCYDAIVEIANGTTTSITQDPRTLTTTTPDSQNGNEIWIVFCILAVIGIVMIILFLLIKKIKRGRAAIPPQPLGDVEEALIREGPQKTKPQNKSALNPKNLIIGHIVKIYHVDVQEVDKPKEKEEKYPTFPGTPEQKEDGAAGVSDPVKVDDALSKPTGDVMTNDNFA